MRAPGALLLVAVVLLASVGTLGRDQRASAPGARGAPDVPLAGDAGALPLLACAVGRWRDRARPQPRRARTRTAEIGSRFTSILGLLGAVVAFGTAGYVLIERWNAFDALYMTVITVASVGYGETHPLSIAGRAFTIVLIVFGLGSVAYGLSTITALWVEGSLLNLWENRKMERRISQLRDHVILCGGGETGRHVALELMKTNTSFVIIDIDPRREPVLQRFGRDVLYIIGDATDGDVLRAARIEAARGLIASMPSDKDNLFTLLTARELNAGLRMVSGVSSDDARSKLLRAGADAVVSGKAIGALRLASEMLRPQVVSVLDAMIREPGGIRVQEIPVGSAVNGQSLGGLQLQERIGIVVFALVSASTKQHVFNPPPQTTLGAGDVLIACASPEQLEAARHILLG